VAGVEWRIAALCEQLADGELEQELAHTGAKEALKRVLEAIRAGAPVKVSVADLDELDKAAASIQIDGLTTGVRDADLPSIETRLPGIGHGPDFAWTCPQRACARVELGVPDVMPVCAVSGRVLDRRTQPR
jgi:hypothetical protein